MSSSWHPRRIGDEVREQVARFGPAAAIGPIVAAWPEAVGEAIAANAWPARIGRNGALAVATSSSVWAFELTALQDTVLERLREALGNAAPEKITFAAGRIPEHGAPSAETRKPPPPPVSEEHRAAGKTLAAGIENPELRAAVARAAAVSLARSEDPSADRPF
jgi:hypothetical protein